MQYEDTSSLISEPKSMMAEMNMYFYMSTKVTFLFEAFRVYSTGGYIVCVIITFFTAFAIEGLNSLRYQMQS